MDKQKQIEEMAKDIAQATFEATQECLGTECEDCRHWIGFSREGCKDCYKAEYLYDLCYRKIPEGSVVLTKEEYEKLQALKDDYVKGYEAGVDEGWDNVRKETAEKFAEMADKRIAQCQGERDGYKAFTIDDKAKYDGDIVSLALFEICKEITEGKDDESGVGKT